MKTANGSEDPNLPDDMIIRAANELRMRRVDGIGLLRVTRDQAEIMRDPSPTILLSGGNRAGKTLIAAARFAAIARDKPIQTMDGELIDLRLPGQKGRPLLMWVVGDMLKHIGQTIHRVLFRAHLYWMIRDEVTGAWRSWNPLKFKNDINRKPERKYAPPLIPQSEIDHDKCAWYHHGQNQFERITLLNGTEIYAYASSGEVKQGDPVDEIWLDESLANPAYLAEYQTRRSDNEGRLFWSTIPRDYCPAYISLEEKAQSQETEVAKGERDEAHIKHHTLSFMSNPFISEKQKQLRYEELSERDRLIRIDGVRSTDLVRIYPEFNSDFHCVEYQNPSMNDGVTEALRNNNWRPPKDWTRELILDPGTEKPGVLFGTIPPKELWKDNEPYLIIYDEIFIRRADAPTLAQIIMDREAGYSFERFIIDGKAAQQKPMGFSWTVGQQYSRSFESLGLTCNQSGSYFIPGDPNFTQRSGLVHSAMRMRPCGKPQLRIVTHVCQELVRQIKKNIRKVDRSGEVLEDPIDRQIDDLRVCMEYWLSRHPTYVEPKAIQEQKNVAGLDLYLKLKAEFSAGKKGNRSVSIGVKM